MANAFEVFFTSRAAIADLVHRYAFNIRRGQPQACEDLFTANVEFHVREASPTSLNEFITRGTSIGREQVLTYIAHTGDRASRFVPLIHNLLIEVNGDEAHSTCMMTNRIYPGGAGVMGEYQDSYRQENGWRFSKRIFTKYVDGQ